MKRLSLLILIFLMSISLTNCKVVLKSTADFPKSSIITYPQDGAENIPTLPYFMYETQAKETTIIISDNKEDLDYPIKTHSNVLIIGPKENINEEWDSSNQYMIFSPIRLKSNKTYYWRYINSAESEAKYVSEIYKFTTTDIILNATMNICGIAGITDNNITYTINGYEVSFYNSKLEKIKTISLPTVDGHPMELTNISYCNGQFMIGNDPFSSVFGLKIENNKAYIVWEKKLHDLYQSFQNNLPIYKRQLIKMLDDNKFILIDIPTNPENTEEPVNSLILGIYDINGNPILSNVNVNLINYFPPNYSSIFLNILDHSINIIIEYNDGEANLVSIILSKENLSKISEEKYSGFCLNDNFIAINDKIYTIDDNNSLNFIGNYYYSRVDYTSSNYFSSEDINNIYLKSCSHFHNDAYVCAGKSIDYERIVVLSKNEIIKTDFLSKSEIDISSGIVQYYYTKLMPDGNTVIMYSKRDGTWDIFSITVP